MLFTTVWKEEWSEVMSVITAGMIQPEDAIIREKRMPSATALSIFGVVSR